MHARGGQTRYEPAARVLIVRVESLFRAESTNSVGLVFKIIKKYRYSTLYAQSQLSDHATACMRSQWRHRNTEGQSSNFIQSYTLIAAAPSNIGLYVRCSRHRNVFDLLKQAYPIKYFNIYIQCFINANC